MPTTEGGAGLRAGGAGGGAAPWPLRSGSTRATPVVLLAVVGALLVARIALGIYEHVRPAERANLVEWRDPTAGEAEARAAGRLVLYYFTPDGVPSCRQMNREVFGDPRMATAISGCWTRCARRARTRRTSLRSSKGTR